MRSKLFWPFAAALLIGVSVIAAGEKAAIAAGEKAALAAKEKAVIAAGEKAALAAGNQAAIAAGEKAAIAAAENDAPTANEKTAVAANDEATGTADAAATARGEVWVVNLEGAVGPASVDLVIRAIEDAGAANAEALVIRMDTPGGLDKSMRDLVKTILAAEVPVVTYVSPDGARAASAGTYIAYASHIAAMAPATNIGSSTPVSIAPSAPTPGPRPAAPRPASPQPAADSEGNSDKAASQEPEPAAEPAVQPAADAMTNKVVNDAVAYLQSLAEMRGRNVEWAEKTVREGANVRATEAVELNIVDFLAPNLAALLAELDGREVSINDEVRTLATANAELRFVETDWRHELLSIITDPSIAYGLLIIGVYGLILEFYNPGMLFPAATGIICLLLGAYGLQMLPVNYAGLALIVIGLGMLIAEAVTPTYGVLGVGGVVAFVMGSVMLMDTDLPGYQLPLPIIAGFAVSAGGIAFFVIGSAVRARRSRVVSGQEGMVGATALVLEDFEGEGTVRAFGEIWRAESDAPLKKDEEARIKAVNGLVLRIEGLGANSAATKEEN